MCWGQVEGELPICRQGHPLDMPALVLCQAGIGLPHNAGGAALPVKPGVYGLTWLLACYAADINSMLCKCTAHTHTPGQL
jgi:hypothetical protein